MRPALSKSFRALYIGVGPTVMVVISPGSSSAAALQYRPHVSSKRDFRESATQGPRELGIEVLDRVGWQKKSRGVAFDPPSGLYCEANPNRR